MKFLKDRVVYDEDEMNTYAPLWRAISQDDDLRAKQAKLSRQVFWASDAALSDGSDPLLAELVPFADAVQREALQLNHDLTESRLRNFIFYVLHHDGEAAEFDLDAPPK